MVRKSLPKSLLPRLYQHEFNALLSLARNTSRFSTYDVNRAISRLDMIAAVGSWRTLTAGGPGIFGRSMRETTLFENGAYLTKPVPAVEGHSGLAAKGGVPV